MFKIVLDETFKKSFAYTNLYEIINDKALLYIIELFKEVKALHKENTEAKMVLIIVNLLLFQLVLNR